LLLPRQSERLNGDWFSLVTLDIAELPALDLTGLTATTPSTVAPIGNSQDIATWESEAAVIAASERVIGWHQPSRHEGTEVLEKSDDNVVAGIDAFVDYMPLTADDGTVRASLLERWVVGS
jgi:hypothetical protein